MRKIGHLKQWQLLLVLFQIHGLILVKFCVILMCGISGFYSQHYLQKLREIGFFTEEADFTEFCK